MKMNVDGRKLNREKSVGCGTETKLDHLPTWTFL